MTLDTQPACARPPAGNQCSRVAGHDGPCAATPTAGPMQGLASYLTQLATVVERGGLRLGLGRIDNAETLRIWAGEVRGVERALTVMKAVPPITVEAHNRALRAAVEAIRDTESRALAIERIEALLK